VAQPNRFPILRYWQGRAAFFILANNLLDLKPSMYLPIETASSCPKTLVLGITPEDVNAATSCKQDTDTSIADIGKPVKSNIVHSCKSYSATYRSRTWAQSPHKLAIFKNYPYLAFAKHQVLKKLFAASKPMHVHFLYNMKYRFSDCLLPVSFP